MFMTHERKPEWILKNISRQSNVEDASRIISSHSLNTVCKSAHCPNLNECWNKKTATFMLLGETCIRNCRFCAVDHGPILSPDPTEGDRIASAVKELGMKFIVLTSVTRDDLPDGGALHWKSVIDDIKNVLAYVKIEALVPDFAGNQIAWNIILSSKMDIFSHNLETVRELFPLVRPKADYDRSLNFLRFASQIRKVKTGIMLGLGESDLQIKKVISDAREAGASFLTLGQYLRPSRNHLPVARYLRPEEFDFWREYAIELGFEDVQSAPLVRSSYYAERNIVRI